jgi:hypothetical protein
MHLTRILAAACVCVSSVLGASLAQAVTVPYGDTVLVSGKQLVVVELDFAVAGSYEITATDLEWLDPLKSLSFGVFQGGASLGVVGPEDIVDGHGALAFFLAAPGKAFLQLYAEAGPRGYGLLSWQAQAVVALPSSIILLGSALGLGLPLWRSRASKAIELRAA